MEVDAEADGSPLPSGTGAGNGAPTLRLADELVFIVVWALIIVASVLLTPGDDGVVIAGHKLPPLCLWRALTGIRCPGCGLTRAFVYMGHLKPLDAFEMHWLGPPFYLLMMGDLARRGGRLLSHERRRRAENRSPRL